MDMEDCVRALYLHACLKYVNREFLTNNSLRKLPGLTVKNCATTSWFIKEAMEMGAIASYDPTADPKMMEYVPWWASPDIGDAL